MTKSKPKNILSPDQQLIAIYDAGKIGKFWDEHEEPFQTFNDLIFEGEGHTTFLKEIKSLYKKEKIILNTISKKDFTKAVITKLRALYDLEQPPSFVGLWQSLRKELLDSPAMTLKVMREIHGIRLIHPDQVLSLGPFKVYNFEAQHALLATKSSPIPTDVFWADPLPAHLIEVEVVARDGNRAYEIADAYFERFERVLKFLVARPHEHFEVGVLSYTGPRLSRAYLFEGPRSGSNSGRTGPRQPLIIDDAFFQKHEIHRFFNLIVSEGNELERRLMLAADWVGQSYGDKSLPSSFLKAAIALETLFTPQENAIITPSILSSLSESLAILLADTSEERLEIERKVKKLYEKRSSITHSGNADVDPNEIQLIQLIAREAILKIFTYENLSQLGSTQELARLIKMNKYAGPPLRVLSERTSEQARND